MKLRNKKTGEIVMICKINPEPYEARDFECSSLAELNEEWEDYKEPDGWCVTMYGGISRITKDDDNFIPDLKEIGNYFNDKESAYDALEKLKAWKVLNDLGFKFCGIRYRDAKNYIEWYVEQDTRDDHFKAEAFNEALHLLFGGTHESN